MTDRLTLTRAFEGAGATGGLLFAELHYWPPKMSTITLCVLTAIFVVGFAKSAK